MIISGSPVHAQGGGEPGQGSSPQNSADPSFTASPLNGNWNLAGNRKKEEFPHLSMFLQVEGTRIYGGGDVQYRCPNVPGSGGGGGGRLLNGESEIEPDGSFTLKYKRPADGFTWEIRGRVPQEGATTWNGEYTLDVPSPSSCPHIHQAASFTATRLPSLEGTFSGSMTMHYFMRPAPDYKGPLSSEAKFTIQVVEGALAKYTLKNGGGYFYLPLVGTIEVKGSSCFTHGWADPVSYSKHGHVASPRSTVEGDLVTMRFSMDDESELNVNAYSADPGESALVVFNATVVSGTCAKQTFHGELEKQKLR